MKAIQGATQPLKTITYGYEEQRSKEIDLRGCNLGLPEISCIKLLLCNPVLTTLKLCYNKLAHKNVGEALAEGLAQNCSITELSIVGIYDHQEANDSVGFAKAFVRGFEGNTRLTKLVFGGDEVWTSNGASINVSPNMISEPAILEVGMTRADLQNKHFGAYGAIIVSAWLMHKDEGMMTSLDISKNDIGVKTLAYRFDGFIALANAIKTNRATSKLNMSYNALGTKGIKTIAEALKGNQIVTELNISNNLLGCGEFFGGNGYHSNRGQESEKDNPENYKRDFSGIRALADAMKNNGVLVKFNVSNNSLCADGAKALAEALKGNQIMSEINLSNNNLGNVGPHRYNYTDMSGVIAISDAITTMGALSSLDISDNKLVGEKGTGRFTTKTYDSDGGTDDEAEEIMEPEFSGAIALAGAISANGALTSLNISNCQMASKDAGNAIGEMLKQNSVLKELDVSNNTKYITYNEQFDGPGFAVGIADGLTDNGTLTSLNISNNYIGQLVLKEGWTEKAAQNRQEYNAHDQESYWYEHTDGHWQIQNPGSTLAGVIAIADAIPTMGALTSLNISSSDIGQMCAPEVMPDGWEFRGVANPDMRFCYQGKNYSSSCPGAKPAGVIALADAIRNSGAISNLNILCNDIGAEQAQNLVAILKEHSTLKTLCGFSGDETEVDLSSKWLTEGCAVLVANEVKDNGALVKFNISQNLLCGQGAKSIAEALTGNQLMTELNISRNYMDFRDWDSQDPDMSGVIAIGKAIPTMEALRSLDMSNNQLVSFKLPEGWSRPDMYGKFESPEGENQKQPPEGAEPIVAGILALADGIKTSRALTHLNIDHDEYTLPHLIRTMKHMIIECALNHRLWPFIRLHRHYIETNSAEIKGIKEIRALAEAFCMNALPGRTCTPRSNVGHPLRKPWLLRIVVDHLL